MVTEMKDCQDDRLSSLYHLARAILAEVGMVVTVGISSGRGMYGPDKWVSSSCFSISV